MKGMKVVMVDGNGSGKTAAHTTSQKGVDVLWITRGFRGGRLLEVEQLFRPRLLVLDASLARWQRERLKAEALKLGWRVYDVAEEGALRLMYNE